MPRAGWAKPWPLLVPALILAGCGGHAEAKYQTVSGSDFHFQAPAGWQVTRSGSTVSAASGTNLLRVQTFMLLKPYRHSLLKRAVKELDTDVDQLAADLKGKVVGRATLPIAGHDALMSTIAYGKLHQQITFVLDGSREYELICRNDGTADEACAKLASTFTLD